MTTSILTWQGRQYCWTAHRLTCEEIQHATLIYDEAAPAAHGKHNRILATPDRLPRWPHSGCFIKYVQLPSSKFHQAKVGLVSDWLKILYIYIKTSRPEIILTDISQPIFSIAFSWKVIFAFWFKFHSSLYTRVHLTISQYCLRWWLGAKKQWPFSWTNDDQIEYDAYCKISNIRRTKSPNLNVPRLVLQLYLPKLLMPGN